MMFNFLRKIPLFMDMPDEDLWQLCDRIVEVHLSAGEMLFEEGHTGDRAFIIKQGELEIIKASDNGEIVLAVRGSGDVIGEMELLERSPRLASVRARSETTLYAITKEHFDTLMEKSPSAANAMFRSVLQRWRDTEAMLRQSEKMAQLGMLTAGVAHELNNPAAAVQRAAQQLQGSVERYAAAKLALNQFELDEKQQRLINRLSYQTRQQAIHPPEMDSLTRSDSQEAIQTWLDQAGLENAWELAPALVDLSLSVADLQVIRNNFAHSQRQTVLDWLYSAYTVFSMIMGIELGAARMSEMVRVLKSYTYLDQAPVQNVDIHKGLDDTLVILRNRIKNGINLRREYASDLPRIHAYGSELNQVWTNLLDNAIYALDGQGEIILRTRQENNWVIVEIEDNGAGIPEKVQPRIFDPFFTTKPPGDGSGLGLDISYNIVVHKHGGNIKFSSRPGKTCFEVWLPLALES